MLSVIGYYTTQFGELWEHSLFDLVEEAALGVLKSTTLEKKQIDAVFFGNMMAGVLENNLLSSAKIAEVLGIHVPIFRTEGACASGGMAFHLATRYIQSGGAKTVMVIGGEKMTDYSPEEVSDALAAASSGEEQEAGMTFPGLYGMMAQIYLDRYRYTEEHLAHVASKNHYHGSFNDKAHFKKEISPEKILKSPYVASPLKILDCSPISDGACAIVLTSDKNLIKRGKGVEVLSSEMATDVISLKNRKSLDSIEATRIAGQKAFKNAGIIRGDVGVAEVHDCFTIAELFALEDLGFWKKGTAGGKIKEGEGRYGSTSKLIINTSGGLKAAGHPVGATGIKQIGEVYLQLTGQADRRQVKNVRYGLAHNVGGSGGVAVVTILGS